jgi:lipopolysaccharide export system protein LptA
MDYRGASGQATYTGHATLWQGETAIRADVITIDLATGNLDAAGDARSSVVLDTGVSVAHAAEIRYADSAHTISYDAGKGLGAAAAPQAQLSGPQGDLRGNRIDVVLGGEGGHVDRLEVYTNVSLGLGARSATGDRLTFYSADERYVMSGGGAKPVRVVEKCKESTGKTITFFKAGDRIIVDGNEEIRTQTKNGAGPACTATPRPR